MNKQYILTILKRFARAFISGGITAIVAVPFITGTSLLEIKTWALALAYAFITGGLMALDKAIRYE